MTNLAARLAAIAEAGQLLIGPETAARLGDCFRLRKHGSRRLKNMAEPVDVHAVLGPANLDTL